MKKLLHRLFKDRRLLALLDKVIDSGPTDVPGRGLPIGNLTSQHFANLYMGRLDHFVKEQLCVRRYLRYMDDMLFFAPDKETLWYWHQQIELFLRTALALSLNQHQTLVSPVSEGVPFLGFRIWPSLIRLQGQTSRRVRKKFREKWRKYKAAYIGEENLVRSAEGLLGHIVHANTRKFRQSFFLSKNR